MQVKVVLFFLNRWLPEKDESLKEKNCDTSESDCHSSAGEEQTSVAN